MLADKAFNSNDILAERNERGAKVVISQHPRRAIPIPLDAKMYMTLNNPRSETRLLWIDSGFPSGRRSTFWLARRPAGRAGPYSIELRERVVAAVEREGLSRHEAAVGFGVAASSALEWVQRYRATGSVAPSRMGGHKLRVLRGEHRDWLLERARRDWTLGGLVVALATRAVKVDYRQVREFAHAERPSFEKSVLPAEQLRPKIARRREQWEKYQARLDPRRLVFIDETSARTHALIGFGS